ncbi:MAG: orotate phosphoribosyltransferase [Cyclobacteriaceae bacterium]|nr:orotate phosphoribosyltransferase [Cyclobacteriaceae bacterium]
MSFVRIHQPAAREVANLLLNIGAIKISPEKPFTWASGWKSPIYCDNRVSLSFPDVRTSIKNYLIEALNQNFPGTEVIAGVATAGIPQATLLADALQKPLVYVRSAPKDHGLENLIEGKLTKGQRVVVVEDLVSTGGSSLKAVSALRSAGAEVLGMLSVFTYGFDLAEQQFTEKKVNLISLSDYHQLLEVARNNNSITAETLTLLKAWRYDPASWRPLFD